MLGWRPGCAAMLLGGMALPRLPAAPVLHSAELQPQAAAKAQPHGREANTPLLLQAPRRHLRPPAAPALRRHLQADAQRKPPKPRWYLMMQPRERPPLQPPPVLLPLALPPPLPPMLPPAALYC